MKLFVDVVARHAKIAVAGTLFVLCCCICIIPICYACRDFTSQEERRRGLHWKGQAPKILVRKRRRVLTISSKPSIGSQYSLRTVSQSSCQLLSKMPVELRQQIWRECLADLTFHLITQEGRAFHLVCYSSTPKKCIEARGPRGCWRYRKSTPVDKRQIVSILLTCRQVYSETIQHLYGSNDYVTNDGNFVAHLHLLFLPQRMECIRSFRFSWHIRGGPPLPVTHDASKVRGQSRSKEWTTVWKNIAAMKGLDELRIKLVAFGGDGWQDMDVGKATIVLQPVMEVTSPKLFELTLTFPCLSDEDPWKPLPCQIYRTNELFGENHV